MRRLPHVRCATRLVGIDTIIHQRPAHPSGVEGQADVPVNDARDGGPAKERAPVESQPCTTLARRPRGRCVTHRARLAAST